MKHLLNFLVGFASSLFIITATDCSTFGGGIKPLLKYIGPAVLFAIIFVIKEEDNERIKKLENKVNELNENQQRY